MAYLTPDTIPGESVMRVLKIPASAYWTSLVGGLLSAAAYTNQWEEFGAASKRDAVDAVQNILTSYYEGSGMIGAIMPYASFFLPDLMLLCDGSTYNRSDYPLLYAKIHTSLQIDADTFRVPDLRGAFILASGTDGVRPTHAPLDEGGQSEVTLTTDQMPAHDHTTQPHAHDLGQNHIYSGIVVPGSVDYAMGYSVIPAESTLDATVTVDSSGGGEAHDNMPPFVVLSYGIVFA